MSPIREQLLSMADALSDEEVSLLVEIARRFAGDDVATPEDLADIAQARAEFAAGQALPADAVNWD